jgi:hypothetical protein
VLFLVFNRPQTTELVLQAIRAAAPKQLFVAADGPRPTNPTDSPQCKEVLSIIERGIDWDCKTEYLVRKTNLGCGKAVSSAISWFFNVVPEGIILEDDCRPAAQFFPFCSELLERYRDEPRVAQIGGFNGQFGQKRGSASYFFSRYFHIWGWASWRRAWEGYDFAMRDYRDFIMEGGLESLFDRQVVREFWRYNFDSVISGQATTWDYQWAYHNFKRDALAIVPNVNMVENTGFGAGATHTFDRNRKLPPADGKPCGELIHPRFVLANHQADDFTYRNHLKLGRFHELKQFAKRVLRIGRLRRGRIGPL